MCKDSDARKSTAASEKAIREGTWKRSSRKKMTLETQAWARLGWKRLILCFR